ncbi:MAG: response regulator transcription factor [Sphingobacteriales bacterium]|uniref:response regulator transcription factor n=1 Tax=Pseudomonas plecoglossicida TaxID=70775 RepID=UPI0010CDF870|nr:response regulator transcription factor [Pseudomonas plecoglossicida]MBA1197003.1 response regulator transcription factor [Pseudomonas plecoglossicida]RYE02154.1 MAG: response regulator transcription factor [Sphingobacteriales bacterium]
MQKALVVDDHPFIRAAVKMLLKHEGFEIVAETDNGVDALHLAREHQPELILLDIAMPRMDGLEVLGRISALGLTSKVLVLTSQDPVYYSARCMKAGASGYISKVHDLTELVKGVKAVMSGYIYFPDLATSSVRHSDNEASEQAMIQGLSDRELSILQQLALGMSNKTIGENLLLSSKTISTYKTRLIDKLNMKSVVYLAEFAKRNNLV